MANNSKLRDQARALENRENWREAVGLYRQLIESPDGEEVDIGLWNRIGDLHLKLNETEKAVEAYESAVNAYAEVGLHNNAIALCRKVLRLVPGRTAVYLRLGQISAAKGFLGDARQNFLEYAERMQRAGKLDASFEALKEFADLSPTDTDVRRLLADQLATHQRGPEAIEQLRILIAKAEDKGATAVADELRAAITAIDPTADTTGLHRDAVGRGDDDFRAAFDTGAYASPSASPAAPAEPATPEKETYGPPPIEIELGDIAPLAGFESTSMAPPPPAAPAPVDTDLSFGELRIDTFEPEADDSADGSEGPALEFMSPDGPSGGDTDDEESDGGELPMMDFGLDAGNGASAPVQPLEGLETRFDAPDEDEADGDGDALPLMDFTMGGDAPAYVGQAPEPAPVAERLSEPPPPAAPEARAAEPAPAPVDRVDELRARFAAHPADASARRELMAQLDERGLAYEAEALLDEAHRALGAQARYSDALGVVEELAQRRPRDGAVLQKQVEYAFRCGERDRLVRAYLALGAHLLEQGEQSKGTAVYQRVLELDPENPEARRVAGAQAAPARSPGRGAAPSPDAPAAPAAPAAEYIDLGALIMDDDVRESTTRFVVEEKEPTGDEDRDFADMLAHFRQKVSENIEAEDSSSHYDLGLAFKEMGLVDEAIAEFQVALRGGANPLATLELLGQCFVEKGQYPVASRVLERALRITGASDPELIGVLYQLARTEEALGNVTAARDHYERVLSIDIRFRDTGRRLEALKRKAVGPTQV
ncbi:MAG TPA: tetratricopeptide repeat protein [Longimicrobiaceae bacterium]|nr:tetratricopeptide repeat protein [Longimicrobiaceae bacterium]